MIGRVVKKIALYSMVGYLLEAGVKERKFLKLGASKDIMIIFSFSLVAFLIAGSMELSEKLLILTRPFEAYQVDELPVAIFSLIVGMAWFSWKRARQSLSEMQLRLATQHNLEKVLKENKLLSQKYINLQEEERRVLARELHDELGQGLNAINIDAVNIRDESKKDTLVWQSAESIIDVSSNIYQLVRNLTHRLRPVALDELGLSSAVKYLIDAWNTRHTNSMCIYETRGCFNDLPENINITVFRLVQEGLTNISKHAAAEKIKVDIKVIGPDSDGDAILQVTINDDGVGIKDTQPGTGLGLVGLRERVDGLGGKFSVEGGMESRGTLVSAQIPIKLRKNFKNDR